MKKSIFLFFAAILCAMSVSAANMKGGEVLYLKPNSNWTQANARFAMFLCNGTSGDKWVKMTKSGDYYMATVPTGDYKNVIFCRMNPANTTDNWSNKWNQSGDLSFNQQKNLCTINSGQWDCGTNVTWSTHKPTSTASLATSSANIFVGGQATLTPSISNTDVNTLKSTSYAISPATGASISGDTFTATTEGEYTITATVTYYPNGCTGLTSGLNTATATTTITASVPAEETNNVTVSYKFGTTEIATATTIASVGVETPSEATAPAITGYTFANWTLGAGVATEDELTANPINITTKSGETDYTLTANYEKFKLTYTVTVPEGTEKCYIVGEMNGWDIDNPIEMTSQGSNVFTVTLEDVTESTQYKYTSQKSWDYADVNESNRTWSASDVVTAWKDPLITNVYLYGAMNGWKDTNPFKKETKEASTASVTVTLEAGTGYEFKIVDDGKWKSNATAITGTITGWTFTEGGGNAKLTTVAAGDYVFTWEMSTSKLSIAYPEVTPEYKDITIQVYANEVPNIWWWNGGDKCADADDAYDWGTAPAMEAVVIDGNTWYQKTFKDVDVALGGIKFKLKSQDQSKESNELQTTEDKCYDARVIATVTETPCGELPTGETPKVTYNVEVPAGTNACYIAGDMNSWNLTEMTKVDATHYTITIEGATTAHKYKYASGPDWKYVEKTAENDEVADRTWTEEDVVAKWASVYDPSAPVYDYYIVGSMNSWTTEHVDYGMTDDDEDGIYEKTLTLANAAEFKVKQNGQDNWYGFSDIEGSYKETSNNGGNIKLTLDADKEVTVIFNSSTNKITFTDLTVNTEALTFTVTVPEGTEKCYICGDMNGWNEKAAIEMEDQGSNVFSVDIVGATKEQKYKYLCAQDWAYVEKKEDGTDVENRTWEETDVVAKWGAPVEVKCYLMGVGGDWSTGIEMTKNPDNSNEYMLLKQPIAANEPIKIKLGNTWCGTPESGSAGTKVDDGNGGTNIALDAGLYDFYYKVNNNEVYIALVGYYRNVTNKYGTICLPYASASTSGATFYEIVGKETGKVYLGSVNTLAAGVPYIFEKSASRIEVLYTGEKATSAGSSNGLIGTFTDGTAVANGNYILLNNAFCMSDGTSKVNANRAYVDMNAISGGKPDYMPGRKYIGMGVQGENEATGVEDIFSTDTPVKVIENGQLIIIRDGVKYNVQGQIIK